MNLILENIFLYIGNFFIGISLILILIFIYGSLKMKTILTKIHFFGAIDLFAIPLFFLGTIFLIFSIKRSDMSFISNLILSGKIFLLIIFIGLGSVLSSHCICKIYFNDDKKK